MAITLTGNPEDRIWQSKAIGEPFPIRDDVAGTPIPPTTSELYRFIKLTHNDAYNTGVLINQTLNNTDPVRPVATGQIDYPASPVHGRTYNLLNTERRFVRAGSSGTLQDDDNREHSHDPVGGGSLLGNNGNGTRLNTGTGTPVDYAVTLAKSGTESRGRNQGASFYMRIF